MLQKDMYLNGGGGGESSIYVVTAEHGGGFYTGYSRGPFGTLGDISSNQIRIGNNTYTILAIVDTDEPDVDTFFVVDKYIDYSNTQVYFSVKNEVTVYTIDSLALDSAIAGKHYLLKPRYKHIFKDISQPTVFNLWISTTPPLGFKASNCHHYKEVA